MKLSRKIQKTFLMLAVAGIISSCSTPKNITYFQDANDAKVIETVVLEEKAIKVQPYDKLSMVVKSKDPDLARLFNLEVIDNRAVQSTSYSGTGTILRSYPPVASEGLTSYTVTPQGTIDFPILGTLKIEGMTRAEVAAFIKGELIGRNLVKDPVVTVEFVNIGFSMLGDVNRPGRYDMNKDVINIIEAISLAGDLSIQGQRENIKVIRRNGDSYQTYTLDLTNMEELTKSPAFYLKQGDVVYVEPNDIRKRQTTNNGNNMMNVSFWLSVVSLITTAAVLLK